MEKIYKLSSRALALVVACLLSLTVSAQEPVTIKTVADKGSSGLYFAKICPTTNVAIDKDEATVYSVYADANTARFAQGGVIAGKYVIKAGECVIIKTSEEKEVTLEPTTSSRSSILWNDLICPATDMSLEDFKTAKGVTEGQYIYMLTNLERNGGFGFTHFGGTTLKAGNFYLIASREPSASGRLDMEWIDADGNVENEATAISAAVKEVVADDAIYNLQGVKVSTPTTKGIYIRNGKKFIVK